jgi:hypothetical protein
MQYDECDPLRQFFSRRLTMHAVSTSNYPLNAMTNTGKTNYHCRLPPSRLGCLRASHSSIRICV